MGPRGDFQGTARERAGTVREGNIAFGLRQFGALERPFAPKKH